MLVATLFACSATVLAAQPARRGPRVIASKDHVGAAERKAIRARRAAAIAAYREIETKIRDDLAAEGRGDLDIKANAAEYARRMALYTWHNDVTTEGYALLSRIHAAESAVVANRITLRPTRVR